MMAPASSASLSLATSAFGSGRLVSSAAPSLPPPKTILASTGAFYHLFRNLKFQRMYVMVVGACFVSTGEPPMIKVHKMVDLSPFPDREAMWYLEVMEAYKLFYQPLFEE
ncbi:uncharacterized protein LOC131149368 isoform X2 [Malania oleifera]|uniref:uncharacterized protein LOC131149368 isoform X2 n=1 Tax=Malania oleifera TaxID=397392 RepID=UPI0025AD9DB5|nr:uncharacterized protein LOC131149368 isoform X2 [Malania oleifera]